jgi:hypothetical protein
MRGYGWKKALVTIVTPREHHQQRTKTKGVQYDHQRYRRTPLCMGRQYINALWTAIHRG